MPTSLKTKIFLSAAGLAVIFLFVKTTATEAATTSTLRGWAWFGQTDGLNDYLSFDCADDVIGDLLDDQYNLNNFPEPRGFHFYAVPCSTLEHNVSISPNGNFVGKAWHNSLGLVSFNGSATPPDNGYSLNSNCPYTCNSSNNCWACYSTTTQEVYGWARVDNTGEWINLHPATTSPAKPVMLQDWDLTKPVLDNGNLNIFPGDFIGYATSTSGRNFSFNCESETADGNCIDQANPTKVPYKVYVGNVQVGYMSAPNWSYTQACAGTTLTANLTWRTRSGEQAAYEIVVNDSNDFDTSNGNYICWSGIKYNGSARQYTIPNVNDQFCGDLAYGTHYYWWIKVYSQDDEGNYIPSEWYQFGNGVTSFDNSHNNSWPKTFLTYSHPFPSPFFTWSPTEVKIGTTTFSGLSSSYYDVNNNQYNNCNGACQYEWSTFGDPEAEIYATTSATTSILFTNATNTTVTLKVTDPSSYSCSTSTVLSISYGLPIWREVKTENR